ncbi:MAG: beta strand repeat-containing protein [Acidobacteriota bacterium]
MPTLRLFAALALAAAAFALPNLDGRCLITTSHNLPAGVLHAPFSQSIATTDCDSPLRFELAGGALPPGLSLQTESGTIAGQPSAAGRYAFTLRVVDRGSQAPSKTFFLQINTALQLERRLLASAGAAGSSYSDQISVSGGIAPYTYALTGALPPGLTLNPTTGAITGVLASGFTTPASFTVRITDSHSPANTLTSAFQIVPNSESSLATTSLPGGTQGSPYSATLSLATGTFGSYLLADGALPAGLTLNPTTGELSGTPTASGSFWFTIQFRWIEYSTIYSAWRTYNLLITNLSGLQFTTGSTPPPAGIGTAYRGLLSPTGGVAPFTYSLLTGTLPPGVTLDATSGLLHGDVGTTASTSFPATLQVTDARGVTASQTFNFPVTAPLSFPGFSLPDGTVGASYNSPALSTTGGAAPFTFALDPLYGALPPGLSFNPANGVFTGTPTAQGVYPLRLVVRDSLGAYLFANVSLTIAAPLNFTTTSPLPDYASAGGTYSVSLAAAGGLPTYTYARVAGALPSGITLNPTSGLLSGSANTAGAYNFTIEVTDSNSRKATRAFTMNVVPAMAITNDTLGSGTLGQPYSVNILTQGSGSLAPSYSLVSGSLPPGLTLSPSTGLLSGIPTVAGTYNPTIAITIALAAPVTLNTRTFSLNISNPVTLTTPSPLPAAGAGHPYSTTVQASGGRPPYKFRVADVALPNGLFFNTDTGILSGIPHTAANATVYLSVEDADGRTATRTYTLPIGPAVRFTTLWLPNGTRTTAYSQTIAATGGTGALAYSLASGSLPNGLTLSASSGLLSGTPTLAGTYNFSLRVTDSAGIFATQELSLAIAEPLTFSTASPLPNAPLNAPFSTVFSVTGGRAPVAYSVIANAPPAILAMTPATGSYGGFPIVPGTYSTTIQARDADGRTVQSVFQHTVNGPPQITGTIPAATVGQPYSYTIPVTGGLAPYEIQIPAYGWMSTGIGFNPSTGTFFGTPTVAVRGIGIFFVTDATGLSSTRSYPLTIYSPLNLTPATLPNGALAAPYSATVAATGAEGSATFALTTGALPAGLTLNPATGQITGTPTASGASTFTITATDSVPRTASRTYTVTISGAFAISTTSLPNGTVASAYSTTLTTENAIGAATFAVTTGTLPAGLTLNPATGLITGTPTASGAAAFTLTATDSASRTATRALTLTVLPRFLISSAALPNATLGIAYTATVETQGALGTPSFAVVPGGLLPPGLTLNPANGQITGTPTTLGASSFQLRAEDSANPAERNATKTFTLTVNLSPLGITTASLPRATAGLPYSQTLAATGGVTPYRWSILTGTLPPNLTLTPATGALSGIVQLGGTTNFTVRVTDNTGATADRPLTLETLTQLGITSHVFTVEQSQFFSSTVAVFGGRPPYQLAIVSGAPPPGLGFTPATATFSGTTSAPIGQFAVTMRAVDALEQTATATLLFNVVPPPPPPLSLSPANLPNGIAGAAYAAQLTVAGGVPPYILRLYQGSLPPGVIMNGAGAFSGTPSTPGAYTFGVLAEDSSGRFTGQLFTIVITAPVLPLLLTPDSLPGGSVNLPYSAAFGATGGQAPYRFAVTGNLPPGVVFTSNATLTGTPTAPGAFRFSCEVTDARNVRAERSFTVNILGPLEITTTALPDAVSDAPYGAPVAAAGGVPPYAFTLSGLPPGLTAGADGALSGTPTAAGSFSVSAAVTDSRGQRASRVLPLTVRNRLIAIIAPPGLTPVLVAQTASGGFAAAGGQPPYQWAVTSGALPPGVGFVSSSGALSGAPTAAGVFNFGVTVTDSLRNTATAQATLRVLPALAVNALELPGGIAGFALSARFGATGGEAPYRFALVESALPPGLALASDGVLAGTPGAAGSFRFTLQVTDSLGNRATRAFDLAIALPPLPPLLVSFLQSSRQFTVTLQLAAPYPLPISGTLTLLFTPDASNPVDDPAVQLASGGRQLDFTIPPGQTAAQFPLNPLRFQVGTIAGRVQLQATVTPLGGQPSPGPAATVPIPRAAPVINSASLLSTPSGLALTVEGVSNTREVSTVTLQFNPAAGSQLETTTLTVPVTAAFNAWFGSAASQPFGGGFRLTLPLTVTGQAGAIESIVVRLTNSAGESQPVTARRN